MIRRALSCTLSTAIQRYCGRFAKTTNAYSRTNLCREQYTATKSPSCTPQPFSFLRAQRRQFDFSLCMYVCMYMYMYMYMYIYMYMYMYMYMYISLDEKMDLLMFANGANVLQIWSTKFELNLHWWSKWLQTRTIA